MLRGVLGVLAGPDQDRSIGEILPPSLPLCWILFFPPNLAPWEAGKPSRVVISQSKIMLTTSIPATQEGPLDQPMGPRYIFTPKLTSAHDEMRFDLWGQTTHAQPRAWLAELEKEPGLSGVIIRAPRTSPVKLRCSTGCRKWEPI